jgi:hypothetical protein
MRTAEYRISNVEGWFRFAQSLLKWTEYIPSTFDIHDSIFAFLSSLRPSLFYDQSGRFDGWQLG